MPNNMIFCDGGELNSVELWDLTSSATISAVQTGMSGSYCINLGSSGYVQKDLGANKTELWFAFRIRAGGGGWYWTAYDSAGTQIFTLIRNNSSGLLEARLGGTTGTLQATGSTVLNLNTTYLVEIHFKPLNAAGDFEVKINSNAVLDIDFSGDTTNGLENCRTIRFAGAAAVSCYLDDIVVDDGAWIGNKKIAGIIKPSAAGNSAQWTPSAGANYECVDEIPPVDTDYNATNTIGNIDMFACNDIVAAISSIYGIQINARMAYEGAPTPAHVQIGYRSGGANYFSSDISPPVSFGQKTFIQMTNQATAAAFTQDDINNIELGYKATA